MDKNNENKIIYIIYDEEPPEISKNQVNEKDDDGLKSWKYITNANYRENGQRNYILKGLKLAKDNDMILISDVDEIPNLENINLKSFKEKIIVFKLGRSQKYITNGNENRHK